MAAKPSKSKKDKIDKRDLVVKPRLDTPAPRTLPDLKKEAERRRCRTDRQKPIDEDVE